MFVNFQEYYSLTKPLNDYQKKLLFSSLSASEQSFLSKACRVGGWDDLFAINCVDRIIDEIRNEFGEDLVMLRIQVLSGKSKKVNKHFWDRVNNVLSEYPSRLTWHILEGISSIDVDKESVYLVSSKRRHNG